MPDLSERQRAVLRAVVTRLRGRGRADRLGAPSPTCSRRGSRRPASAPRSPSSSELGLVSQPHTSAGRVPDRARACAPSSTRCSTGATSRSTTAARSTSPSTAREPADGARGRLAAALASRRACSASSVAPRLDRADSSSTSPGAARRTPHPRGAGAENGAAHRRVVEHDAPLSTSASSTALAVAARASASPGARLREVRELLAREAQRELRQADRMVCAGARARRARGRGGRGRRGRPRDRHAARAARPARVPRSRADPRALRWRSRPRSACSRSLDALLAGERGVQVALGGEVDEPALHRCALVAARYGDDARRRGARRDRTRAHGLRPRDLAGRLLLARGDGEAPRVSTRSDQDRRRRAGATPTRRRAGGRRAVGRRARPEPRARGGAARGARPRCRTPEAPAPRSARGAARRAGRGLGRGRDRAPARGARRRPRPPAAPAGRLRELPQAGAARAPGSAPVRPPESRQGPAFGGR